MSFDVLQEMNKLLGWALVCQLLVIILGVAFYQSVRVELGPAQIRQGVEMGRHQVLDDLREAEVSIPEELDQRLPNNKIKGHTFYQNAY